MFAGENVPDQLREMLGGAPIVSVVVGSHTCRHHAGMPFVVGVYPSRNAAKAAFRRELARLSHGVSEAEVAAKGVIEQAELEALVAQMEGDGMLEIEGDGERDVFAIVDWVLSDGTQSEEELGGGVTVTDLPGMGFVLKVPLGVGKSDLEAAIDGAAERAVRAMQPPPPKGSGKAEAAAEADDYLTEAAETLAHAGQHLERLAAGGVGPRGKEWELAHVVHGLNLVSSMLGRRLTQHLGASSHEEHHE
jgi:hypothetical protein